MAEQSFFFNSVAGDDREYDQAQMSMALKHAAASNGVSYLDYTNPLFVQRQPNGGITIQPGVMLIEGFVYFLDAVLAFPAPTYLQGTVRTDRVIIRLNKESDARFAVARIVSGIEGSATPPDLVRVGNLYEMSLALLVFDGASLVVQDTRHDAVQCGFIGQPTEIYVSETEPMAPGPFLWYKPIGAQPVIDIETIRLQETSAPVPYSTLINELRAGVENMTDDPESAKKDDVISQETEG